MLAFTKKSARVPVHWCVPFSRAFRVLSERSRRIQVDDIPAARWESKMDTVIGTVSQQQAITVRQVVALLSQ